MYKVQAKFGSTVASWSLITASNSESCALRTASTKTGSQYKMVRVICPNGSTVWSR